MAIPQIHGAFVTKSDKIKRFDEKNTPGVPRSRVGEAADVILRRLEPRGTVETGRPAYEGDRSHRRSVLSSLLDSSALFDARPLWLRLASRTPGTMRARPADGFSSTHTPRRVGARQRDSQAHPYCPRSTTRQSNEADRRKKDDSSIIPKKYSNMLILLNKNPAVEIE
jgi:hypothetical protein